MKNNTYRSADHLIQGIKDVLSKNRCSFSVEEQVLLEDCIKRLEETKNPVLDTEKREIEVIDILMTIYKIFSFAKDLFDTFNN
ncbi:hypothetical protein QT327_04640 [Olivibacter sp. 47]|uniref:hypothetical protein n=1 Tax=Olivibacter sp. 47 TaxID=3056486 RepID=UPI0025A44500|nr:hypothetical protein [Olivibacter sp. 47]MDM8173654.1 hypothetical protein [Olivibacter sp. 47]